MIQEGQFADDNAKQFTSEDIRFTLNHGCIYAICLNLAGKDGACIKSFAKTADANKPEFSGIITNVEVLGENKILAWKRDENGLHIKTNMIAEENPVVFKITTD